MHMLFSKRDQTKNVLQKGNIKELSSEGKYIDAESNTHKKTLTTNQ